MAVPSEKHEKHEKHDADVTGEAQALASSLLQIVVAIFNLALIAVNLMLVVSEDEDISSSCSAACLDVCRRLFYPLSFTTMGLASAVYLVFGGGFLPPDARSRYGPVLFAVVYVVPCLLLIGMAAGLDVPAVTPYMVTTTFIHASNYLSLLDTFAAVRRCGEDRRRVIADNLLHAETHLDDYTDEINRGLRQGWLMDKMYGAWDPAWCAAMLRRCQVLYAKDYLQCRLYLDTSKRAHAAGVPLIQCHAWCAMTAADRMMQSGEALRRSIAEHGLDPGVEPLLGANTIHEITAGIYKPSDVPPTLEEIISDSKKVTFSP